jgi:hypothetical protein
MELDSQFYRRYITDPKEKLQARLSLFYIPDDLLLPILNHLSEHKKPFSIVNGLYQKIDGKVIRIGSRYPQLTFEQYKNEKIE